jgi:hypothetical protein
MRIASSVVGIGLLCASPAYAKNDQVRRAPVPSWVTPSELMPVPEEASGLMFVRRNDAFVNFTRDGQEQYQDYRIKILHTNALQLGNLALAWNPAAGAPTVHAVKIYRGDEVIDVLQKSSFEILRREDQLEAARLDGLLTAVLRIPDLRVGDELEVAMTLPGNDPTLKDTAAGLLTLDSSPSSGRFRLGLSWAEGEEPHVKMSPDLVGIAKRREHGITFDFDNPRTLSAPKDSPPRYRWQRVVEFSDFADWPSVSRRFAPLYTRAAQFSASSPLRAEARKIAATNSSPLQRASAALELVQKQVRYIYVGLNGGNLAPATADETWQRRYGDCKGKTVLLLGLLKELGIDAEPVLVSNAGADDGADSRLPNPGLFDHVLIRAHMDGSDYWLDGTLPAVAGPSSSPVMPYRWVLPLTQQGTPLEHIPWHVAETPDEVNLFEIDARAGFNAPAHITSTMIVRGIKGLQQQIQFSGVTPAQLLDSMRQAMVGDTWQKVDDARWRYDTKSRASILTISGTGIVDWESESGGGKYLRLPGGGFNPPEKRVRSSEQDQSAPFYNEDPNFSCHVTTVRLPTTTQSSQWSYNTSFETRFFGRNYYRAFAKREGEIHMVRGSRTEQLEIDAATAKADNARTPSFDNSMGVITYDPIARPERTKESFVPATYEIDWSADQVPCLGSSAARLKNALKLLPPKPAANVQSPTGK